MEIADYLAQINAESDRLLDSAAEAGLDTPVPSCPDWRVRDLVLHIGGIHRWAADLVAHQRTEFSTEAGAAVGTGPGDGDLLRWARDGRDELLAALRSAPADVSCFTMWPADSALGFWARRQSHETAIHRADADGAAGRPTSYDDAVAVDGIEEMLHGFTRRKKPYEPVAIRLDAGVRAWQITMGADGIGTSAVDAATPAPDVTVSGPSSDVYLWLWNRPANLSTVGDAGAAARWEQVRVRWS